MEGKAGRSNGESGSKNRNRLVMSCHCLFVVNSLNACLLSVMGSRRAFEKPVASRVVMLIQYSCHWLEV